jgi:cytochrome P450/NADPH-cytochrome P450 reductase
MLAVLKETLRVSPPVPARLTHAKEDTTLGDGKWEVKAHESLGILHSVAHMDPTVWGEDVRGESQLYLYVC